MGNNIDRTIKDILRLTLKYDYTDFDLVSDVVDFCNGFYNMRDNEIRTLDLSQKIGWTIEAKCIISYDGYDNEIKRFEIERR